MHQLINILHERYPDKKFYLSGFSLGGNVILKLLGELGEDAAKLNIAGAAVTCVPFDPVASQGKLDTGFNRWAYSEVRIPFDFTILSLFNTSSFLSFSDIFSDAKTKSRSAQSSLSWLVRH